MNNIKWYYEATSQQQLDDLIKFLVEFGYKSKGNNYNDYEEGCFYIGITNGDQTVYCTNVPNEYLIGERTGDIEVFKAQFKTEKETETKADLIAQRDALNERIAEMEANEPCVLSIVDAGGKIVAVKGHNKHHAVWVAEISSDGKLLLINNEDFDIKEQISEGNNLGYTFHKKQS